MSRTLQSEKQVPLFHPSIYETTMADTPQGTRSIREFEREYTKRISTDDLNTPAKAKITNIAITKTIKIAIYHSYVFKNILILLLGIFV